MERKGGEGGARCIIPFLIYILEEVIGQCTYKKIRWKKGYKGVEGVEGI